jgi:hypothetical protein
MEIKIQLTEKELQAKKDEIVSKMTRGLATSERTIPEPAKERVARMAEHDLVYGKLIEELGQEEARKKMGVLFHKEPSQFHDLYAFKTYREPYMSICCDRKKAIDEFLATASIHDIYNAVKDVELVKDTYVIEIKE